MIVEDLLTIPLSKLLNFTGYDSVAIESQLYFRSADGDSQRVSIAIMCSGIYSVTVFIAALFSYAITIYSRLDFQILLFLILGIFSSYLANIFRMYLIVLVGYYRGMEASLTMRIRIWVG